MENKKDSHPYPTIKVGKWGNNLGIRFPKDIVAESDIQLSSEFTVTTQHTSDGRLRLVLEERPQPENKIEIAKSLSGIIEGLEEITDQELTDLKIKGRLQKYGLSD